MGFADPEPAEEHLLELSTAVFAQRQLGEQCRRIPLHGQVSGQTSRSIVAQWGAPIRQSRSCKQPMRCNWRFQGDERTIGHDRITSHHDADNTAPVTHATTTIAAQVSQLGRPISLRQPTTWFNRLLRGTDPAW